MAQIGDPVKCDETTSKREKVQYARVLVRVQIDQNLPNSLVFLDEKGLTQECRVEYEWKPTQCSNCLKFGHELV